MAKAFRKSDAHRALRSSALIKAGSRARVAKLASQGQGEQALREASSLLGIDVAGGAKLRLSRVRSFHIG